MRKVLLAVDGSDSSGRAARYVIELGKEHGSIEVHLINVEPRPLAWQTHGMETEIVDAHLKAMAHQALSLAEAALAGASNLSCHSHARFGDVAATIAATADKLGCDAIVMGRRGLGSVAGLLLGSTTIKVLHLSSKPVILVK